MGKPIHSEARTLILKVLKFFENEKANKQFIIPVDQVIKRTCTATGISKRTLMNIKNEAKVVRQNDPPVPSTSSASDSGPTSTPKLSTPGKKRRSSAINQDPTHTDRQTRQTYNTPSFLRRGSKMMAFSKEPSKYDKGLLPKPSWSADRGGQSSTVEPPSTPEQNSSDCDPVYDTPLEARLRKQLTRKTALYVKHSKHNILLRQKVIRLKRKCASLKQVLLSNPQKKKRSQEELELIEQFNKDSTDEDISGDGSSDEEISNETQTGASKATRANMASSDDSDYEGELYDFGNFVTEQLLSLNVEESRVAQMKIKNLLAEFMKTHTVDSYSEPSTSKTQPTQAKKRKMQSKAKQHKNKAVTEPASELQTHSLSLSDTPLQFEVQQMRNDTAITQAGYVVTPTLTDGVNWVKNEGFTVLLAGFDTSPEVFMAQSEPAQAVSYGTPVDQISVKVEPGATSTESPLYADTIVKVEPSETEGSLQATEKECVVFKIEPEEPEEEEV